MKHDLVTGPAEKSHGSRLHLELREVLNVGFFFFFFFYVRLCGFSGLVDLVYVLCEQLVYWKAGRTRACIRDCPNELLRPWLLLVALVVPVQVASLFSTTTTAAAAGVATTTKQEGGKGAWWRNSVYTSVSTGPLHDSASSTGGCSIVGVQHPYTHTHTHAHAHMHARARARNTHARTHARTHTHTHTHTHTITQLLLSSCNLLADYCNSITQPSKSLWRHQISCTVNESTRLHMCDWL